MLRLKSFKLNNIDMESVPGSPLRNGVSCADANEHIGCRRDSTTEAIVLPDLIDDSIQDWENNSESTTGLDNSFSDLAIQLKDTLNCAIDKVKADRWQPKRLVEAPKYRTMALMDQTEHTKAMAIVSDRAEFRKLKLKLKESGMLTNYSVRAILNPELENSASEIASKSA